MGSCYGRQISKEWAMDSQSAVNVGEVWQDLMTLPSMPLYRIVQPPHSFLVKYSITKDEQEGTSPCKLIQFSEAN